MYGGGSKIGMGLGAGLSQLGLMLTQERAKRQAEQQRLEAEQRANKEWRSRQAYSSELDRMNRPPEQTMDFQLPGLLGGGSMSIPADAAKSIIPAMIYAYGRGGGQQGGYDPEADKVLQRELYKKEAGIGDKDPTPRDPGLALNTSLESEAKIDKLWLDNLPPGGQWDWLLATGGAPRAKAMFAELIKGGASAPVAAQAVAEKLGEIPEGYYLKPRGDSYSMYEDKSFWPDRKISDPEEISSLRQMLLGGYGKAAPDSTATTGAGQPITLGDGGQLVQEGGQWIVIGPDGNRYKPTEEDFAEAGVR